jgi:hypothetical protein
LSRQPRWNDNACHPRHDATPMTAHRALLHATAEPPPTGGAGAAPDPFAALGTVLDA